VASDKTASLVWDLTVSAETLIIFNSGFETQYLSYRGTVASVVIQAIGSGANEETLMKATHPMIRLGQFGA